MEQDYIGPKARELSLYIKNNLNEEIKKKVKCVTHTSAIILHILRNAEERNEELYQKDLEAKMKQSKSTMCETLNCMEKHELIKRVPSKKDSRKNMIVLTSKGKEMDLEVGGVITHFESELSNKITKEEKEMLFLIIDKLMKEEN